MQPTPEEEARRWFLQSEHDLDDAHYLASGGRHNLAAFHAQQAAEKAWKAFLYAQGLHSGHSHSVSKLGDQAAQFDATLDAVARAAAPLDLHYIPTRYPNGLAPGAIPSEVYDERQSSLALGMAAEVLQAVRQRIVPPDQD